MMLAYRLAQHQTIFMDVLGMKPAGPKIVSKLLNFGNSSGDIAENVYRV